MIQDLWLLLDDCSTINIICNPHIVTNIHKVNQRCIISTNADTGSTNLKATLKSCILPMKEEVWFDYTGIANIIALHSVQDNFRRRIATGLVTTKMRLWSSSLTTQR